MPGELVFRVLETGDERLVSSDVVSQGSLDSLEPGLAEALENGLRFRSGAGSGFGPRLNTAGCTPGCGMAARRPRCP